MHRPTHHFIQIHESHLGPRHVVGGPGVTDPDLGGALLLRPELDVDFLLMEMHRPSLLLDGGHLRADRTLNLAILRSSASPITHCHRC
jgi:hypothetical protein